MLCDYSNYNSYNQYNSYKNNNYERYKKIERPLKIKTTLYDFGRFPFHTVDLTPIISDLKIHFNVEVPSTFVPLFSTNEKSLYDLEKEMIDLYINFLNIDEYYEYYIYLRKMVSSSYLNIYSNIFDKNTFNTFNNFYVSIDKHYNTLMTSPIGTIGKFGNVILCIRENDLRILWYNCNCNNNNEIKEFFRIGEESMFMSTHKNKKGLSMNGIHSKSHSYDHFFVEIDYNKNVTHSSNFFNTKTKTNIKTIMTYNEDNKIKRSIVNKNNLLTFYDENCKDDTCRIISKCMIDDEKTGLRFRGTYDASFSGNKINYKTLLKDDEIVYSKKGDEVLVNNVTDNKNKRETEVIGWKVAENEYGEKRIIKLIIMPDARVVQPIDSEFFHTRGKERCNKAIVADIQYPEEEKEISVVPNETTAYSYLFGSNNVKFEYKIGKEVIPDTFDDNENVSCTNGIHYYRNRKIVFDVYVNR